MGGAISSIFSSPKKPDPPPPPPVAKEEPKAKKASTKTAQLIALKATGSSGLLEEANVGRRKILV